MVSKDLSKITKNKKDIFLCVFFNVLGLFCNIFIIYNLSYLIVFGVSSTKLIVIFILVILKMLFTYFVNKHAYLASEFIRPLLRNKIYDKIYNLARNKQNNFDVSEISQLASEGVEQLEIYYTKYLPQLFYSVIAPVILFIIIFIFNKSIAIILICCVPLIPLLIVFIQKIAKRILNKYWGNYTNLGKSFFDLIGGIDVLKNHLVDEDKQQEIKEESESFRVTTMKVLQMQLNSIIVMDLVAFGGSALAIYMGVVAVNNGELSLFVFIFIMLLIADYFIPLRLLGSYFHIAMNGMAACSRIFKFLNIKIDDNNASKSFSYGDINITDLSFKVGDDYILSNISTTLNKDSFIGITGISGSGKSTFAKTIAKDITNFNGSILIDNVNINLLSSESFKKKVIYLSDKNHMFMGTIREFLNVGVSDELMLKMLDFVCLKDKFKLDDVILENGMNLSGGEKQRLILARGLLLNGDVYILDEITSSVDHDSEIIIMDIIKTIMVNKIVICISHKISNIVNAQNILFFKDGDILNEGNHDSLMKECSDYKELYLKQHNLESFSKEDYEF